LNGENCLINNRAKIFLTFSCFKASEVYGIGVSRKKVNWGFLKNEAS